MTARPRTGVILLNLGGPGSQEEIRPFLLRLFADREIIRLPGGRIGQALLSRVIVRKRLAEVKANYALIGGGSPILPLTTGQASGLEARLRDRGCDAIVGIAMRYTSPGSDEALLAMRAGGVERLVALTLYPHYSKATTGSSLAELERARVRTGVDLPLAVVDRYPEHPGYLDAMAERIREAVAEVPEEALARAVLLFSAHSLPQRFIDEGDPYLDEIKRTVGALAARFPEFGSSRLSFQSRAGPVKWIGPDTDEVIEEMAAEGIRDVVVVPVSFVSDHVETLYEVDLLYGDKARAAGISGWRRAPALNASPRFLDALADLAEEAMG